MEDSEKMMALKKAYAEVILNTAKEAAARIMVSERRTHRVQHDLSWTKEEALRLFLLLKQTMDSKLNDAEIKSLHQLRRIKELEAQLQKTEDIISNLRAELNEVHMRLKEMENNQMLTGPNMTEKTVCGKGMEGPQIDLLEAVLASRVNGLGTVNGDLVANNSLKEYGFAGVPNVPSIITTSKKPELYRNGCTQRIQAYEGNMLNGHFSLSGELDDQGDEKKLREDKEGERIPVLPPIGADITCIVGKKPVDIKEVKNVDKTSCKGQSLKSFCKKKKRAARFRRSNASELKSVSPVAKGALSYFSNSATYLHGSQDMPESFNHEDKGTHSLVPSTALANVECVALAQVVDESAEVCINLMDEDRDVASSLVLIRQQSGSGDCLDVSSSNRELAEKNISSTNLDMKVLDAVENLPSPLPKDRVLKYTFQRKRKKETLSSDDSSLLPQENPLKRKMGKKQSGGLEPPKSTTLTESSRDSRRMAQVARQLISLSEKKWWK